MKTVFEHLRGRLLERAGLLVDLRPSKLHTMADLESQWVPEFEDQVRNVLGEDIDKDFLRYCHNRMMMGGLRYGLIKNQKQGNGYANIDSAIKRYNRFVETGNSEWLCDFWNLIMIEFAVGRGSECTPLYSTDVIDALMAYKHNNSPSSLVAAGCFVSICWSGKEHPNFHFEALERDANHPTVKKS